MPTVVYNQSISILLKIKCGTPSRLPADWDRFNDLSYALLLLHHHQDPLPQCSPHLHSNRSAFHALATFCWLFPDLVLIPRNPTSTLSSFLHNLALQAHESSITTISTFQKAALVRLVRSPRVFPGHVLISDTFAGRIPGPIEVSDEVPLPHLTPPTSII